MSIDTGPVTVGGAVKARRARVIYNPGTLYVVHGQGRAQAFDVPEHPVLAGSKYKATTTEGQVISWYRQGCSCSYTLGSVAQSEVAQWATSS